MAPATSMSCMSLPPMRLPRGFASLGKMTSAICDCEARTVRGSSVRGTFVSIGAFCCGLPSFICRRLFCRRLFCRSLVRGGMPRQVRLKITLCLGLHTLIRMHALPLPGGRLVAQLAIGYRRVPEFKQVLDGDQCRAAVRRNVARH